MEGGDIASVNGQKITRAEFNAKLEAMPQAKPILNQLVQGDLIDQYAAQNHIDIPDSAVTKEEDDIKSKYPPGQFEQILKAQNLTEADVRKILRQKLIVEKAVSGSVHVTDADITSYLQKNHATLDTAEQVRARHILVPNLKTAQMVEAKLRANPNAFAALAKQYSTDPASKDKGGELGFFSKGQMVPAFQNAAFTQQINVIGPPVKSPFGYHIIEVEEKKAAQVATLANSRDKIKQILTQQQEQQQIPQFLASLRSKANIQVYDDVAQGRDPACTAAAPSTVRRRRSRLVRSPGREPGRALRAAPPLRKNAALSSRATPSDARRRSIRRHEDADRWARPGRRRSRDARQPRSAARRAARRHRCSRRPSWCCFSRVKASRSFATAIADPALFVRGSHDAIESFVHGLARAILALGVLGNPLSDFPGLPLLLRALERAGVSVGNRARHAARDAVGGARHAARPAAAGIGALSRGRI